MTVLTWLKDKALWLVGGIVLALGILFAVKFERKKIDTLKNKSISKVKEADKNAVAIAKLQGREQGLSEAESIIEDDIDTLDQSIEATRSDANGRTADEVATKFNDLYGDRARIDVSERR